MCYMSLWPRSLTLRSFSLSTSGRNRWRLYLDWLSNHESLVLFPIRLDDAVMETDQAWASNLRRTRHIGDFLTWKDHDPYQESFNRLLRDLKA